ncbi:MAG: hypothetical protein RBS19_03990 [Bacteroidales bacterium]|nr:hypothetical protein [Bacteroidales bacterium]
MKTFNRFVLVVLTIGITTLLSCKKDDKKDDLKEDPINSEIYNGQISAKIGNNNFTAQIRDAVLSSELLWIQGISGFEKLVLIFTDRSTLGYHTLEKEGAEYIHWMANIGLDYWSESGTILITEHDRTNKIIKGTFNATMYNFTNESEKLQITNGVLNVKYVVQ